MSCFRRVWGIVLCLFLAIEVATGQSAFSPRTPPHASPNSSTMPPTREIRSGDGKHSRNSAASDPSSLAFLPAATFDTGGYSSVAVISADLNGDGKADLLTLNQCTGVACDTESTVAVLLGNGDGTFQAPLQFLTGGFSARSQTLADVNDDGTLDLIVANGCATATDCSGSIAILLGVGDGTFLPPSVYNSGGHAAQSITTADVNGDGTLDVLITNLCTTADSSGNCLDGGTVGVLLGNGDGTFQAASVFGSGGYLAYAITEYDLNGDGIGDLVVANQCTDAPSCTVTNGNVGILFGLGDGTFQSAVIYDSGGQYAQAIAVADANADGNPDVFVLNRQGCPSNCSNGAVGVLIANGDSSFQSAVIYDSGGQDAYGLAVRDLDGDGVVDLEVTNACFACANGSVGVLVGNGDGTYQTAIVLSSGGYADQGSAISDVNGDGRPDIVAVNCSSVIQMCGQQDGQVAVLLNVSTTPTSTVLTAFPDPSNFGQSITFTATVTVLPGFSKGTPTGSIQFFDGSTGIGSSSLDTTGMAQFPTSTLTVGTHTVSATYSGDGNFTVSNSPAVNELVQGTHYDVGSVVTVGTTSPEAEQTIVANGQNLVSTVMDFSLRGSGFATNKLSVSNDGGNTWSNAFVPLSSIYPITADGATWRENRDPALAVDSGGNVYLAGVYQILSTGKKGPNPAGGIYVCVGVLPGVIFDSSSCHPVITYTGTGSNPNNEDRPWVAVDATGIVYVAWIHSSNCATTCSTKWIAFSRSLDHGVTWSAPLQVSTIGNNSVFWPEVAVAPNGTIYVGYETSLVSTSRQHLVTSSNDQGQTFTAPVPLTPIFTELSYQSLYRKNSGPNLAVDPRTGVLYDAYVATVRGRSRVQLVSTQNPAPVTVDDSRSGQRVNPAVAVAETSVIHLIWYDTRSSGSSSLDVYGTYSMDEGTTFLPNARITSASFKPSSFIGDYNGIAVSSDGAAHPVWSGGELSTTTVVPE